VRPATAHGPRKDKEREKEKERIMPSVSCDLYLTGVDQDETDSYAGVYWVQTAVVLLIVHRHEPGVIGR
jgi:hypothetical protein